MSKKGASQVERHIVNETQSQAEVVGHFRKRFDPKGSQKEFRTALKEYVPDVAISTRRNV
jgi:hypothetical protein